MLKLKKKTCKLKPFGSREAFKTGKNKDIFSDVKASTVSAHQICPTGNAKGCPSDQREMIADGNSDLQEGMKKHLT